MLEDLYYFEKLMEFKQREDLKKSKETWRYSSAFKHHNKHKASAIPNTKQNSSCVDCC